MIQESRGGGTFLFAWRAPAAVLALLLTLSPAGLQAAGRRILIIKSKSITPFDQAAQSFKRCLSAKAAGVGFQEIILPDDPGQAEATLRTLSADRPDMALTVGTQATRVMREKFRSIPSVFCMVIDPNGNDFAKSGVSMDPAASNYVDYIRKNFANLKRIGVLYNPMKSREIVQGLRDIDADSHNLVFQEVSDISGLDNALRALKNKADCLLMTTDASIYNPQTAGQIILQTLQMNMPFIALSPAFVKGGALAGIYADPADNGCQAADLAVKVLDGEGTAGLPVLPPRKVNSAVNLIVADRLKVIIPSSTRAAADQVVQQE
jgi:putative ABC transport system substrate-binding protein